MTPLIPCPTQPSRICTTAALAIVAGCLAAACTGGQAKSEAEAPAGQGRGGTRRRCGRYPRRDGNRCHQVGACHRNRRRHGRSHLYGTSALSGDRPAREGALRRRGGGQAGQLLFTLDPQPFQVALDQATAALARDTAQADNAQAQVGTPQEPAGSRSDPARAIRDAGGHRRRPQGNHRRRSRCGGGGGAEPAYTRIIAPATGRTGALQAHEGDFIQAGGQAPLVMMNQLAPIYVAFSVPGKLLDSIRRLQRSAPLRVSATAPGADRSAGRRCRAG